MKFKDQRTIKNTRINIGDLIIGKKTNYMILRDRELREDQKVFSEFCFHVLNISTLEIQDSFRDIQNAYNSIHVMTR